VFYSDTKSFQEENMKQILSAMVASLVLVGAGALAQSEPVSDSTTPPAIVQGDADSHTTAAPVAGRNSFTETEARARLEKHGYTAISALQKDEESIWRGTATKDGKPVRVAVDYQGNIVAQ